MVLVKGRDYFFGLPKFSNTSSGFSKSSFLLSMQVTYFTVFSRFFRIHLDTISFVLVVVFVAQISFFYQPIIFLVITKKLY